MTFGWLTRAKVIPSQAQAEAQAQPTMNGLAGLSQDEQGDENDREEIILETLPQDEDLDDDDPFEIVSKPPDFQEPSALHNTLKTVAGIAGNVLEWYDFAVFAFFSDILGVLFFPKSRNEDLNTMESFAIFGGAFLMRPIGGLIIGYIGDVSGRKKALEISIFLMAIATTLMGLLPTYKQIGGGAIILLCLVRMLQGLSVGGQLMSSLVFTVESRPRTRWGLYGSCVMAAGNFGTFLGGVVAYVLRTNLTMEQLLSWGWRIPFLSGILISFCGIYLKYFCQHDEIMPGHVPEPVPQMDSDDGLHVTNDESADDSERSAEDPLPRPTGRRAQQARDNPLRLAFAKENRRALFGAALVPVMWSGGFYLSFVWLAIYMKDLISPPVEQAFAVNSISLLLLCIWFPIAGLLSDLFGRKKIMTAGAIIFGCLGPISIFVIGRYGGGENPLWIPFCSQLVLSVSLAFWGAPMCAWLVEAFEPKARSTSVCIGYNVAQAIAGGVSPLLATLLVENVGIGAPGILLVVLTTLSMTGLWCVAPQHDIERIVSFHGKTSTRVQLKEIC
jgi:MHS family proline/betaine transporter-like MFS transporter